MPRKHRNLGERIRLLRQQMNLTLEQVANETGRSVEYLRRIEANEELPPVAMLLQLARALRVEAGTFLKADGSTERLPERAVRKTDYYTYLELTGGDPPDKKLKAFAITIPVGAPPREGVGYRHAGEEFAYVLEGEVEYTVGENVHRLGPGGVVHFDSAIPHNLVNIGEQEARLLVILYTP